MNKNFTFVDYYAALLLSFIIFLSPFSSKAQITPKLKFRQPKLVSGTGGQVGAIYKFSNVTPNINAYVKIEDIVNGAILKNIDDSTLGYYDAWQPTVGGPGIYGSSYIKWDIRFDTAGVPYVYSTLNASAIDVDGDNVKVREFVNVNGQSSYSIPTQIPSLLTISKTKDTDNINGTDASDSNLHVLGPVMNRTGIDTLSQDVRINFTFKNQSEFKIYTGSQVDDNGATGAIATDRYHCIYFMDITSSLSVLPVKIQSFDASLYQAKVKLYWTTDFGTTIDHFEVERSFDQNNFSTAAIIFGSQSSNKQLGQYTFTDASNEITNHSLVYYRLKSINLDGGFSYSSIKVVRIDNSDLATKPIIKVLPNPCVDKLDINFKSYVGGTAEVKLINISGGIIKSMMYNIYEGANNLQIGDLQSQPPGFYVVNISVNGKSIDNQKIVKL